VDYLFAACWFTYDEDCKLLVGSLSDGDGDCLDDEDVVELHLPPPLPPRLGREAAARGVGVHGQPGIVVPEGGRLHRRLA
jgi:hypothetical protein